MAQQRLDHAVHRMQPRALHQSAVKDQRHHGRALGPVCPCCLQIGHASAGPVDPRPQQRCGGGGFVGAVQHGAGVGQKSAGVGRPALDHIGPERIVILARDRGQAPQVGVGFVIAGQGDKGHARVMQMGGVLLQPVFPVPRPAQHAGDHQFGFGRAGLDMQIDRHRVLQVGQIGQPQGGGIGHFRAGLGQGGQFCIGGGYKHHIGRSLAKVDGFLAVVN